MKNRKEKMVLKLTVLALAMAMGMAALPRNAAAESTDRIVQVQWQQTRVDRNQPYQQRQAWARWQSEQIKKARLYQQKVVRAETYRARVVRLERKARVQLAKIESWYKRAEKLERQKAAREKQRRAARATAKNTRVVQVMVRAD